MMIRWELHAVAVRWGSDGNRYRVEPDDMRYSSGPERFEAGTIPGHWATGHDWITPFTGPHPHIRRWTEPMRRDLRSALRPLGNAEKPPGHGKIWWPSLFRR
jgi:hypothetical protein